MKLKNISRSNGLTLISSASPEDMYREKLISFTMLAQVNSDLKSGQKCKRALGRKKRLLLKRLAYIVEMEENATFPCAIDN